MNRASRIAPLRQFAFALLLAAFLLNTDSAAKAQYAGSSAKPVHIGDVIHVLGFGEKSGGVGDLSINEQTVTFTAHGRSSAIPLKSIVALSTVHGDKPLLTGAKGKVAQALPYGVGFIMTMSRPGADTLTILYEDSSSAIHGAVLVLPKDSEEQFSPALEQEAHDYPMSGVLTLEEPLAAPPSPQLSGRTGKPDIEVALPSESVAGIPSAIPVAIYEEVIEQLTASGLFAHVWRAHDTHKAANSLVLHLDLNGWKQGSARGRGFGPFTGATEIQCSIKVEDGAHRSVFEGSAKGSKRLNGENLEATIGLAKHVRKELEGAPIL
jgi:hypothetical protein